MERFRRQMIINGWGDKGQSKLKSLSLAVAGLGGLGSPLTLYLSYLGIGKLILIDGDEVSVSNLNRQILYGENEIGEKKAFIAAEKVKEINSNIDVVPITDFLSEENIDGYLRDIDGIVDGLDNMKTRFLLNEFAVKNRIPFFHGAIYGFEGRVTTFVPDGPCLACLYKKPVEKSGEFPAVGPVAGTVATIQVQEVIKYFLGFGENLIGKLLIWDGINNKMFDVLYEKDKKCPVCGGVK